MVRLVYVSILKDGPAVLVRQERPDRDVNPMHGRRP